MKPISQAEFRSLVGPTVPTAEGYEECGWYAASRQRVLGVVLRYRLDGDYRGQVFVRDDDGNYREVSETAFGPQARAEREVGREMRLHAGLALD
jgi:hypothetical protein